MGRPIKLIGYLCFLMALCSCKETKEQQISRLIHEWEGRTIVYPADMTFSVLGKDSAGYSFPQNEYTIMTYVDSVGCTGCKLQLPTWKRLISMVDTVAAGKVSFLFAFHPKNKKEISFLLKRDRFLYPVFIDEKGDFDALNHFPSDVNFQTFLLDSQNKVLAIGNPVHNKKVRDLYLQIIAGQQTGVATSSQTKVVLDKKLDEMGDFDWKIPQTATFSLRNLGDHLLIIEDINASCGCTSVTYSKEPVPSGKSADIQVTYRAEHPEHFEKTITVYCNTPTSPICLKIRGNAIDEEY